MDLKKGIGKQIRAAREKKGWSQAKLGDTLGVSKQYMSGIENGRKTASIKQLQAIAEILDCEISVKIS